MVVKPARALGRHVGGGADVHLLPDKSGAGNSEVEHLDLAVLGEADVVGLDVPVEDAEGVCLARRDPVPGDVQRVKASRSAPRSARRLCSTTGRMESAKSTSPAPFACSIAASPSGLRTGYPLRMIPAGPQLPEMEGGASARPGSSPPRCELHPPPLQGSSPRLS